MFIYPPTLENIQAAAQHLRSGHLVAIPTETVYGLAANALDSTAVARIFAAKERPHFDPLIIHIPPHLANLPDLIAAQILDGVRLTDIAKERFLTLTQAFWPGPLTLVLPRGAAIPDLVTSGLDSVAIRCPAHPVAQALLTESNLFLAAPSANRFGRISPTSAAHVESELAGRIDFILDGGVCTVGIESTIIAIDPDGALWLLRPGGASIEAISQAAGVPVLRPIQNTTNTQKPQAPGMLSSHYAPRTPMHLLQNRLCNLSDDALQHLWTFYHRPKTLGVLIVNAEEQNTTQARLLALGVERVWVEALTHHDDWTQAAQHLFAAMRALDASGAEILWAEDVDKTPSLAYAIQDRLQRASVAP